MEGAAMIEIQRVLCPVDFSETSRHALDHALAVAKWYEARVTVLHVIHPLLVLDPPVLFVEASREPALTDVGSMRERLRKWLDAANAPGNIEIAIDEGNPVLRILSHAASLPADLIVMGTHGRSGFDRFALGSVAEKVLRKAGCPVVTVPPPAIATSVVPVKRLLCPVDFSESSLAALRFAFSLARESDARLTILHAVEWPASDEASVVEHVFKLPDVRRQLEKDSHDRLASLIPADVRPWCQPVTKVVFGRPHVTILNIATEERADLIVMGVRGRAAMDLTLFGSTTNQVVRRANCPVLTLRTKA
jgi:nucleotide-binding universal stress UspA family protein